MELVEQLFLALRDLRDEVNDTTKRIGWCGRGACGRADAAINRYLNVTRSAPSVPMIADSETAPAADNSWGTLNTHPRHELTILVMRYGDACRADEMKGGGDPASIPEIEMEFKHVQHELFRFIATSLIERLK